MKRYSKLPFSNVSSEGWENLAILAVLTFYIIQVGFDLFMQNMCGNLAMDYCAYFSTGKIANNYGYSRIYDLDLLTQFQKPLFPNTESVFSKFEVIPVPYFPIFVVPFQIFSLFDLAGSFWVWTILNLIAFIYYLRFFVKEMTSRPLPTRLVILLVLSLPLFLNLFWGQVNIWLTICAGEYMRSAMSGKAFRAGLWLGGWLLKPQLLILIIPILLIRRWMKTLAGFTVSSVLILLVSFVLARKDGFLSLKNLLFGYMQGMAPEIMMNWRMVGVNLSFLINPIIGWSVALIGSALTVIAIIYIWKQPVKTNSQSFGFVILATFAATGAFTWHAHLSMSLVLVPALIYLYMEKRLFNRAFLWWVFMPTAVMFIIYILAALISVQILPSNMTGLLNFLSGLRGLALNLYFVIWTIVEIRKGNVINNLAVQTTPAQP